MSTPADHATTLPTLCIAIQTAYRALRFPAVSGYVLLPDGWAGALLLFDWSLTACGVIASAIVVVPRALLPATRRRAAHVLAWLMAADAVVYLASFAIMLPLWAKWIALDWWVTAGISIGTLCTFWIAVVVFRRTAQHRVP